MPQLLVRIVITLLAASSLSVIAPPVNLHWLHWVALAPMMWVMRPDMPRSNRWLAFTYGTVSTLIIFRWLATTIMTFSNLNPALAWIATGLFAMVFGLPWLILWTSIHPLRRRLGAGWVLAIPALQVVLEYSQMLMFLFPYNLGVSQYRTEWVWQLGSVTGIAGITFLLFFVNATLAETAFRRAEGKPPPLSMARSRGGCSGAHAWLWCMAPRLHFGPSRDCRHCSRRHGPDRQDHAPPV
jgi:apolipoprotein N-acyltransferase